MTFEFISLIILLLLSGFFSASETAFTSLSLVQVQTIIKTRKRIGKKVQFLTERPDLLLTTILIGNNLVNILATAIATTVTTELFGSQAIGIMTGVMTLLVLIFAEVTPKRIAIAHNTKIACYTAYIILYLSYILRPFIWIIGAISNFITRLFSAKNVKKVSLEGILHLMNVAEDMGVVRHYEKNMVQSVFRFKDQSAGSIITHRTDVFQLDKEIRISEAAEQLIEADYSRIPVYSEDPENIVGIVLYRSIMHEFQKGNYSKKIKDIMLHPLFIPETKKISEVFHLFKSQKLNMAIVLDEYGGFEGIITLEDVAEELFGDLYDEDEIKEVEKVIVLGNNRFKIAGDAPILQVEDAMNIELRYSKNVQTITGFILEQLDDLPVIGQIVKTDEATFKVESMVGNKVLLISAELLPEEE